jgi:hypothetical protein
VHDVIFPGRDHAAPGSGTIDFAALKPMVKPEHIKVFEFSPRLTAEEAAGGVAFVKQALGDRNEQAQEVFGAWDGGWDSACCCCCGYFHSIFLMNEGKIAAQNSGLDWSRMAGRSNGAGVEQLGPQDLWHTLRLIHPAALLVSFLLVGLALLSAWCAGALCWKPRGLHLPLGRATRISFVAQFFNSFLLGSTGGDLIKAYYAARETHHKKTEAVTTVFVDRLVGLWAMLLFACLMMIPNYAMLRGSRDVGLPALFILAMLGGLSVVLGLAFWGGVSKGFPQARAYLRRLPKGEVLERALDSCRQFGSKRVFCSKRLPFPCWSMSFGWCKSSSWARDWAWTFRPWRCSSSCR